MNQVFVLGTGRCGSTLLSDMLRLHPGIASISEFFSLVSDLGCRVPRTFPAGSVSGEAFWDIIATPWPRQNLMLRHDVAMEEVIYPWKSPTSRFNAQSGVPAISQVTLPHLSDTPDALFDEVQTYVRSLDPAPIGIQYQRLFQWLATRQGASCWVERSGGGLRIVRRLLEHFPEARFIHLVRDGRNTALSMSRHLGFRMVFASIQMMEALGVDPFESADRRWEEDLPDDLDALLPEHFTQQAFLDFETPPPLCGHYWSGEVMEGLKVLDTLAPDRVLSLRYEDFLETPAESCRKLLEFIQPSTPAVPTGALNDVDRAWMTRATALVGRGRSAWQQLEERPRRELERACKPGMEALERAGLVWT